MSIHQKINDPVVVYGDGLCEPHNPNGIACYGLIIQINENYKIEKCGFIGKGFGMSNNVAEYCATVEAMNVLILQKLTYSNIIIRSDSQLVVNQMNGVWSAKKGFYTKYYEEAQNLKKQFKSIRWQWIRRNYNIEADKLSRKAYEEYCKKHGISIRYMF